MTESRPRFTKELLSSINSDDLKHMAQIWGAKGITRKADFIALILNGLNDPDKVRTAIQSLVPWERQALALIKQANNWLEVRRSNHWSGVIWDPDPCPGVWVWRCRSRDCSASHPSRFAVDLWNVSGK